MNDAPPHTIDARPFLADGGEMGRLMRSHDWHGSALGPAEAWPQPLRTLVAVMLGSRQPMFVAWGPERTILYNDDYAELLGRKHPEALGQSFLDVWSEIRNDLEPLLEQVDAGGSVRMDDITLVMDRHGYAEETHFAFSYTPVWDEAGAVAGMFCVCTETTDKVIAELALRAERDRSRGVLEGMGEGFVLLDCDFRILEVNAEAMRLDRRPRRDLVGRSHWEAYPGTENSPLGELYKRALRDQVPVALEHRYGWEDGHDAWIDMRAYPTSEGLAIFFRDISPRKAAEATLRESEAFTRRVLESSTDCIKVLDLDAKLEFMSAGGMGVMEIEDFGAFKGACWPDFWLGKDNGKALGAVAQAKAGGTGRFQGFTATAKGNMRYWDVIVTPILGEDGQPEKLLSISRDISEQHRSEDALRESEARFRNVADHAPVMIWTTDPTGSCTYLNRRWYEFTGQTEEEALGLGWTKATHPDDEMHAGDTFLAANAAQGPFKVEYRLRRADGVYRWAIDAASPRFGPSGEFLGHVGSVFDIDERREAEARLALSEQSLRLATEAAEVGTWDLDLTTDVLTWSDRTKAVFGVSPGVPCSMADFYTGLHPEDRAATSEAFALALDPAHRGTYEVEYRTIGRDDGLIRWVAAKGRGTFDDQGRCIRAVGTAIDITARKATEERLRESEARARELAAQQAATLGQLAEGVIVTDADGRITLINEAASRIHGVTRLDVAPDAYSETYSLLTEDGRPYPFFDLPLARAVRGETVLEERWRIRRPDGEEVLAIGNARPVLDLAGRQIGAVLTLRDDTARVAAEAALRDLNATLEQRVAERTAERDQLWDLSEDLLAVANYEVRLLRVSPSWTRLFGYDEETLLTRPYGDIIHPDDLGATMDALLTMRSTGRPVGLENRILAADGTWRWVAWTVSPEPGGERLIAVGRDITTRKAAAAELEQAQEQLRQAQKMEAVGQLTGGIAHDFNNLLTGIVGSLDLMQTRIAQGRTEHVERYAKAAMSSANRAAALTHRLLAFARRQPLDPKPVNANALVASMEDLLRRTIGETIEMEIVTAGGLWITLCDPHQLESAILNLAINARDAMPEGGKLTIETANSHLDNAYAAAQRDVTPGQYVAICVTDTGTGMSPDLIARAFDPFFTTKPIGQGTGLGLSMVYGFTKQSEGHTRIYSEVGQGTTIRLYLPRYRGAAVEETAGPSAAEAPRAEAGETVLVVEDEPVVRNLIVEVLQDLGYRALEAADGPAGLNILQSKRRIDLLITDVGLPGLNGRQMADQARERRPGLKILFITGYAENATVANGFLEPGMEMITKPFAVEALATRIRQIIERG